MTRHDHARKAAARARMAVTHEPYSVAARKAGNRARPATGVGTRPEGWPAWAAALPATVAVWRDRDGSDEVVVLESGTDKRLAGLSVPHVATETLLTESSVDLGDREHAIAAALGRPDLTAHRLGYQVRGGWYPWTDGSWRAPAVPAGTRHTVTAEPSGVGLRLIVREQPGDLVVAETVVGAAGLDAGLDGLGYTAAGGRWSRLPGGVFYALARPGRLAERDWWTEARVRVARRIDAGDVAFEVGQVYVMHQHGPAGAEVDRGEWCTETERVPAAAVEVLEVLEDHPPTWHAAALTAERIVELLAPYHPLAERAAAAWTASRLHIAQERDGLVIRTAGPEHRRVGRIGRDYWFGNVHSDPYQVTLPDNDLRELADLPLDPLAAWDNASRR